MMRSLTSRGLRPLFLAALTFTASVIAQAGEAADLPQNLPTCYDFIGQPDDEPATKATLFVVVDQTVKFPQHSIDVLKQEIGKWLVPGRRLVLIRFAANLGDRQTSVVYSVKSSTPGSDSMKDWLKRSVRTRFEQCERDQPSEARRRGTQAFETVMLQADPKIPRSDILFSLQTAASQMHRERSDKKVVLILSDMLENSSAVTFYANNNVRIIAPEAELAKVEKSSLIADFESADIYVYGTGYVAPTPKSPQTYVGPDRMKPILAFWNRYFSNSHGNVREIGAPELLGSLQ